MEYVKRVKDLREDSDKTQQDLAKLLKTTRQQYGKYENGMQELPIRHLLALADYYHVTTDYILGRTNNPHDTY